MDNQKFLTAFLGGVSVGVAVVNMVTTVVHTIEIWHESKKAQAE